MADLTLTTADEPITINAASGVNPGDTIYFTGGTYNSIVNFLDVQGTQANPINVVPISGPVTFNASGGGWSILFDDSQWLNFQQGSVGQTYPWRLADRFKVHQATGLVVQWWEALASASAIAFHLGQDQNRVSDVIDTITFRNCWVHDRSASEAFYLGSNRVGWAAGEKIIGNITVEDCLIEDCREGIALQSCPSNYSIQRNRVLRTTPGTDAAFVGAIYVDNSSQAGNTGTIAYNWVEDCDGHGITHADFQATDANIQYIYNNVILNVGYHATSGKTDGLRFRGNGRKYGWNNTIIGVGNGTDGMGVSITGNVNSFARNCIMLDCDADAAELGAGLPSTAIDYCLTQSASWSVDSTAHSVASLGFVDSANGDYRIRGTSPAKNAGTTGSGSPTDDYRRLARLGTPDIGAYEHRPTLLFFS